MTPPAVLAELEAHVASPVAAAPRSLAASIRCRSRLPVPLALAEACAGAVEAAGGDAGDLADLLDVHRRALADSARKAAAIRSQAMRARCRCADGGLDGARKHCERCWGVRP